MAGAVQSQTWDPSVKSLCAFPTVLEKMNEKIDWTQKLGDAFLAQQKEVMQAVQVLRNKAKETGNLKSTKEVTVKEEPAPAGSPAPQTIIIESPDPEVVYVPTYNPTVVYGAWGYPYYPPYSYYPPGYAYGAAFWSFTAGVIVGGAIWGNCNWGGNDVDIDINRQNNFNRNEINNNRNSNNTATALAIARATIRRPIARATTSRAGRTTPTIARVLATRIRPHSRNSARAEASRLRRRANSIAAARNRAASRCRAKAWAISATWRATASARATWAARRRGIWAAVRAISAATAPALVTWAAQCQTRDMGGGSRDGSLRGSSSRSSAVRRIARVRDPRAPLAAAVVARAPARPAVAAACRAAVEPWRRRTSAMNREHNENAHNNMLVLIASLAVPVGLLHRKPQDFESPEAAVQAMVEAAKTEATAPVLKVLGEDGEAAGRSRAIRSRTRMGAREFCRGLQRGAIRSTRASRMRSCSKWARTNGRSRSRSSGRRRGWHFDSAAGAEELINRRVGENELDTIQSCLAYVDAQREYYMRNPEKDSLLHYASRLISTEGKKDGLYWPAGRERGTEPARRRVRAGPRGRLLSRKMAR